MEETEALVSGVETCGGGKWADIKKLGLRAIERRSAVDLKDKWRNLQVSNLRNEFVPVRPRRKAPRGQLQLARLWR